MPEFIFKTKRFDGTTLIWTIHKKKHKAYIDKDRNTRMCDNNGLLCFKCAESFLKFAKGKIKIVDIR